MMFLNIFIFFQGGVPENFDPEKGGVFENFERKKGGSLKIFEDPPSHFLGGGSLKLWTLPKNMFQEWFRDWSFYTYTY